MPFLGIIASCFLLLIVTTSSHASLDINVDPFIQYSPDSENGAVENVPKELHRQKRQVAAPGLSPKEYAIVIQINSTDMSLLEFIKDDLQNLSFPVEVSTSDAVANISSINITTVCSSISKNEVRCFCEPGYSWPAAVCHANPICPGTIPRAEEICDCLILLSSQESYCQHQPGGTSAFPIKMSVRLNVTFQDALRNSSSELYMKYTKDLEDAFTAGYKSLPGFISARVTGFRNGSVIVDYEVRAAPETYSQIGNANGDIAGLLNASYMLDSSSFFYSIEKAGESNFIVSPQDIFQGDTVIMKCERSFDTVNVTWWHSGLVISNSSRHLIHTEMTNGITKSILKITNVTQADTGFYICNFKEITLSYMVTFKITNNISITPIDIVSSEKMDVVCNGTKVLLSCCIAGDIQSFTSNWRTNEAINNYGTASNTTNCTEYTLHASQSHCPSDKSGTTITYTCELHTGHGAIASRDIQVTYFRVASVRIESSNSKAQVSEGRNFSLTCISDVSNYDNVVWQIQGKIIDQEPYINTMNSSTEARSVLTVNAITQAWNGTYICTFFQKFLQSSAYTTVEIVPLLAKQHIVLDPIEGFIQCDVSRALTCCTTRRENYNVTFTVQQREFIGVQATQGNQVCYLYNYTESCNSRTNVTVYCTFVNHIQDKVESFPMRLTVIPKNKVMCSDIIGVGEQGKQITKPCPDSKNVSGLSNPIRGNIIYGCIDSKWMVASNTCLSDQINTLFSAAESLVSGPQPTQQIATYLETLHNETGKEQEEINNSPANLNAVITILNLVSNISTEADPRIMTNFLSTVDIIVSNSTIPAWKKLNNQEKEKSSQLLNSVERFSQALQPVNNTIPSITNTNLQLQGIVIPENSTLDYNKTFTFSSSSNLSGNVLINSTKIQSLVPNTAIISVAFSTLRYILPMPNETDVVVNGLVMTTTVSQRHLQGFQIAQTFAKGNTSLRDPQCVFWNFSLSDGAGGWDGTGCQSKDNGDNVICICDHLTSFSILMSPYMESTSPGDPLQPLDYITYIGLSISLASLVLCIVIECLVWKSVTKNRTSYMRHVCILNIAVCLLIADVWFIVAAALQDTKKPVNGNVCIAATFFIHLFYLCVFFWMLATGLMLFYRLVFILHDTSKTIQKTVTYSLGYGCPLIIAVITIAVTYPQDAYRRENACWLNWENSKALLAFVIPALTIVAVNSIIAVVVIVKILRPAIGEKPSKQERNSLNQVIKSIGILTPLLGLTWGFGLATVIKDSSIVFHILFTLLNAFQGLFILVFGTLWDKKVQEALLNAYSFTRWSTQQAKSTSLDVSAPVFSMSSPFSGTLNNLFGKTGKYTVSSTDTCSSTEYTSNTYSLLQ
nr:adhesion G protein-coupled receptor F5 [Pelodiscus sinensis]XP_006120745.1 adhesion G protein-coupled receptor F5 [Pelodiscus sinensis]XP_025039203.1 adhesion G protein-coupled receptor F5 [Pelodiscus sinensis]XP_025039204.1 adhesion G protein-coupled receptor F5 [Pelodiscus sinensis]|eukprot:XP_006120744.1 adhesion G protein-coupled receptor F5 [Pelodiscus sinensis]